jgi:tRNA U54 and U55 pseudouridine synthase Pus10
VLHRRSLLDRTRHVYRIETTLLNSHFFLMRLVTSAGTHLVQFTTFS